MLTQYCIKLLFQFPTYTVFLSLVFFKAKWIASFREHCKFQYFLKSLEKLFLCLLSSGDARASNRGCDDHSDRTLSAFFLLAARCRSPFLADPLEVVSTRHSNLHTHMTPRMRAWPTEQATDRPVGHMNFGQWPTLRDAASAFRGRENSVTPANLCPHDVGGPAIPMAFS